MSGTEALATRLEALRRQGAPRIAPARWLKLQALAHRMVMQPDAVQAVLRPRVQAQAEAIEAQLAGQATSAAMHQPGAKAATLPTVAWPRVTHDSSELAGAVRFRRAWSRSRAQESVSQAATQRPANAGPLNSHALAQQSLAIMGALPADYLRRFVAHVEALQWLEAVAPQVAPPARKARRPAKAAR